MALTFDPRAIMAPGGVAAGLDNLGSSIVDILRMDRQERIGRAREERQTAAASAQRKETWKREDERFATERGDTLTEREKLHQRWQAKTKTSAHFGSIKPPEAVVERLGEKALVPWSEADAQLRAQLGPQAGTDPLRQQAMEHVIKQARIARLLTDIPADAVARAPAARKFNPDERSTYAQEAIAALKGKPDAWAAFQSRNAGYGDSILENPFKALAVDDPDEEAAVLADATAAIGDNGKLMPGPRLKSYGAELVQALQDITGKFQDTDLAPEERARMFYGLGMKPGAAGQAAVPETRRDLLLAHLAELDPEAAEDPRLAQATDDVLATLVRDRLGRAKPAVATTATSVTTPRFSYDAAPY